jgi:hypothetical protein
VENPCTVGASLKNQPNHVSGSSGADVGSGIKQIPPYEFRCCLPKRTNGNCLENFLDVINSDASYCFLFNVALAEKLIEPKLLKQQRDDMAEPEG